jgi:hypothetical protein
VQCDTRSGTDGASHQTDRENGRNQIPWVKEPAVGAQAEASEFVDHVGNKIDDGAGCPWNSVDMCTDVEPREQEKTG